MCVEAILIFVTRGTNVAKAEEVQFFLPSSARRVDREKNGTCYQASKETQSRGDLQISKQEEGIEGMVVEDMAVGGLIERPYPVEEPIREVWRSFSERKLVSIACIIVF